MKYSDAMKIHNEDEVVLKKAGQTAKVLETLHNSNLYSGQHVAFCVCYPDGNIEWVNHKQIK